MNYLPDQMLRNLEPQRLTRAQQGEVDEQLGTAFAAISRRTSRVTQRVRAWTRQAAMAKQPGGFFRKLAGPSTSPQCADAHKNGDNLAVILRK